MLGLGGVARRRIDRIERIDQIERRRQACRAFEREKEAPHLVAGAGGDLRARGGIEIGPGEDWRRDLEQVGREQGHQPRIDRPPRDRARSRGADTVGDTGAVVGRSLDRAPDQHRIAIAARPRQQVDQLAPAHRPIARIDHRRVEHSLEAIIETQVGSLQRGANKAKP